MQKTAYMGRADAIVLLTAHCASNLLDAHGGADGTPKRIVDFASKLADELVAQGVVAVDEPDEDTGGPFKFQRASEDDSLDLDEAVEVPATEPVPPLPSPSVPAPTADPAFGTVNG